MHLVWDARLPDHLALNRDMARRDGRSPCLELQMIHSTDAAATPLESSTPAPANRLPRAAARNHRSRQAAVGRGGRLAYPPLAPLKVPVLPPDQTARRPPSDTFDLIPVIGERLARSGTDDARPCGAGLVLGAQLDTDGVSQRPGDLEVASVLLGRAAEYPARAGEGAGGTPQAHGPVVPHPRARCVPKTCGAEGRMMACALEPWPYLGEVEAGRHLAPSSPSCGPGWETALGVPELVAAIMAGHRGRIA